MRPPASDPAPAFEPLTERDVPEMIALTELTKPGAVRARVPARDGRDYFRPATRRSSSAMAGERMRVPGYTEMSAICTHPDHVGRGHAAALMAFLLRRILERDERPFLHVKTENTRAIALYERMGFERTWVVQYVGLQRVDR